MLLYNSFRVILVFVVLRTTDSARKIRDGYTVDTTMNFVVYITKAQPSSDTWLCGGSIVSPYFIATTFYCASENHLLYAIAGYKKYVKAKNIASDECTKASRKKIIETRVLKDSYDESIRNKSRVAMDIGVVKVESPYDFSATSPLSGCSWVPGKIVINTEDKFATPGTDAMVLGWGHTHKTKNPDDPTDYNEKILRYVPIQLIDKQVCRKRYETGVTEGIATAKYMICAMDAGTIDEKGDLINKTKPTADGCVGKALRVGGECQEPVQETLNPEPSAVDYGAITFDDIMALNLRRQDGNMTANTTSYNYTRKAGICQNDLGGPLVTWVGGQELLIGVAQMYRRLTVALVCIGPSLFTSTHCHAFLTCVVSADLNNTKTKLKTPLGEVHATRHVNEDTGERAKGSKEFLLLKKTPDKNKDRTRRYDTHDQDQNNGHDNIYDRYYYDSYQYEDGSSLRQDPNKKDNGDESRKSFVRPSSDYCNLPDSKFDVVETRISWKNHPDGPAANEL